MTVHDCLKRGGCAEGLGAEGVGSRDAMRHEVTDHGQPVHVGRQSKDEGDGARDSSRGGGGGGGGRGPACQQRDGGVSPAARAAQSDAEVVDDDFFAEQQQQQQQQVLARDANGGVDGSSGVAARKRHASPGPLLSRLAQERSKAADTRSPEASEPGGQGPPLKALTAQAKVEMLGAQMVQPSDEPHLPREIVSQGLANDAGGLVLGHGEDKDEVEDVEHVVEIAADFARIGSGSQQGVQRILDAEPRDHASAGGTKSGEPVATARMEIEESTDQPVQGTENMRIGIAALGGGGGGGLGGGTHSQYDGEEQHKKPDCKSDDKLKGDNWDEEAGGGKRVQDETEANPRKRAAPVCSAQGDWVATPVEGGGGESAEAGAQGERCVGGESAEAWAHSDAEVVDDDFFAELDLIEAAARGAVDFVGKQMAGEETEEKNGLLILGGNLGGGENQRNGQKQTAEWWNGWRRIWRVHPVPETCACGALGAVGFSKPSLHRLPPPLQIPLDHEAAHESLHNRWVAGNSRSVSSGASRLPVPVPLVCLT